MTAHIGRKRIERVDKDLWYREQLEERDRRRKYEKKWRDQSNLDEDTDA